MERKRKYMHLLYKCLLLYDAAIQWNPCTRYTHVHLPTPDAVSSLDACTIYRGILFGYMICVEKIAFDSTICSTGIDFRLRCWFEEIWLLLQLKIKSVTDTCRGLYDDHSVFLSIKYSLKETCHRSRACIHGFYQNN